MTVGARARAEMRLGIWTEILGPSGHVLEYAVENRLSAIEFSGWSTVMVLIMIYPR